MRRHSAATLSFFVSVFVVVANRPATPGPDFWTSSGLRGRVTRLVIAPSNPKVLYAYHFEEGAVLKSTDAGSNWTQVLTDVAVSALGVHPSSPDIVVVSGYSHLSGSGVVLRSNDGGTGWYETDIGEFTDPNEIFAVQFHPANPDTIDLVGLHGIYRSVDGGTTWSDIAADICFT